MSLSILSDTNTHAYKYTVVKLDHLSFVSTRSYSLAVHIAVIGEMKEAGMNTNTVFTRAQMPVFLFLSFYCI